MLSKHQQLYLRQFFSNYFVKKEQAEEISLLKSSLEVLLELTISFTKSHGIYSQQPCHSPGIEGSLQLLFQQIYFKVNCIFTWFEESDKCSNNYELKDRDIQLQEQMPTGDDELYGILHEYKINNQNLKQQIKQLSNKIIARENQNSHLLDQINKNNKSFNQKIQILQSDHDDLLARLSQINTQLDSKSDQNQILSQKISQLSELIHQKQEAIKCEGQKVSQTTQKYLEEREKHDLLKNQYRQLKQSGQKKIAEELSKIPKIIQAKLNNKQNWRIPTYNGLVKFVKHLQSKRNEKVEKQ